MSSFDNMQRTVEPEKVLEDMICVAIPAMSFSNEHTVSKAIFNDAIEAGLTADEIHNAVNALWISDRYDDLLSLLFAIDKLAVKQLYGDDARINFILSLNEEVQS